ncbi:hypothetical protein QTP88_019058 [Uroleucon formosanum]
MTRPPNIKMGRDNRLSNVIHFALKLLSNTNNVTHSSHRYDVPENTSRKMSIGIIFRQVKFRDYFRQYFKVENDFLLEYSLMAKQKP